MCHCKSNRFEKEDLAELGWQEINEPPPTYEELELQYLNYQYFTHKELLMIVEDAGGEIVMTHYTMFLLEELRDGPYWENLGLELFYE